MISKSEFASLLTRTGDSLLYEKNLNGVLRQSGTCNINQMQCSPCLQFLRGRFNNSLIMVVVCPFKILRERAGGKPSSNILFPQMMELFSEFWSKL